MPDFLPRRDADLLAFANNFNGRIAAAPADFGLTPQQAANYAAAYGAFAAAYQLVTSPRTRSPSNIFAKDAARAVLKQVARQCARTVRAAMGVSAVRKAELGLRVRAPGRGAPIGPPQSAPLLHILATDGRRLRVRLRDATSPTRLGKPARVTGAQVFHYVGDEPPTSLADYTFNRNTSLTTFQIEFGAHLPPGTKVWLAARWFNPRAQPGPACSPVGAHLGFGGLSLPSLAA